MLVRHVKFHKIEMSQLQVLLTFCEEDLRVNISYIFFIFTGCNSASATCEVSQDRDVSTPSIVNSVRKILGLIFPIYFLYLQAVTVLVRHVKFHKIEMSQLQVLLTFCEEDLHDYNRQSTAFTLLKVLII